MTTGKTIALTVWTFVSKVMSLLFNTLSKCVYYTCQWFPMVAAVEVFCDARLG